MDYSEERLRIGVAVWDDGRVVWSGDLLDGGAPYRQAFVSADAVRTTREELMRALGAMPRRDYVVPDAASAQFTVRLDEHYLEASSSHELFESNPGLVAVDGGIESLEGRSRADVLRKASPEWRAFRDEWVSARGALERMVPAEGDPIQISDLEYVRLK
jgi:hypothetical protein